MRKFSALALDRPPPFGRSPDTAPGLVLRVLDKFVCAFGELYTTFFYFQERRAFLDHTLLIVANQSFIMVGYPKQHLDYSPLIVDN